MTAPGLQEWIADNQRYLAWRVGVIRSILERHAGATSAPEEIAAPTAGPQPPTIASLPLQPALITLTAAFGLSAFEADVLVLCAGVELDAMFPSLCARAQGRADRTYPTFGLALAALPEPHWSALTAAAPLRYWRLIEVLAGDSLTTSALRIDEHILHYLAGVSFLDQRLHGILEVVPSPADPVPSHRELAEKIASCWSGDETPLIQLAGREAHAKRAVAVLACERVGALLHAIRGADVPESVVERDVIARLWQRESVLGRKALLIECDGVEQPRAALALAERLHALTFIARDEPITLRNAPVLRFEVRKPTQEEQRQLWHAALGAKLNGSVAGLVSQFDLDARAIAAVSAQGSTAPADTDTALIEHVWEACRNRARGGLDDLAQPMESIADWGDLVLPPAQLQVLRDIAVHVRWRARVHETWGFAAKGRRGLGISALFAGASGTGKTMAAEVLARELRLDLYRIDLSQVVSKYIGETEKNLRRVFDAAESSGAVLLFDEADALFGKRTEVKDSHDRYANIEVSYLLQRMESYRGLAILTTNMKGMLDSAFLRRLRFIVQFPAPDSAQRAEIWRRVFPRALPHGSLDVAKLARLNVTGGNIRNIALYAAFLAAESNEPVQMAHLLRAARSECAKLDRQLTDNECRDWA
jgi:hypothetical protein